MKHQREWLRKLCALGAGGRTEREVAQLGADLARSLTGMAGAVVALGGPAQRPEVLYARDVAASYLDFLAHRYMELPGKRIIATGIPAVVRDVEAEPAYGPFLDHYRTAGIRGMILLPLRSGAGGEPIGAVVAGEPAASELFGVLGLYHPTPIDPDAADVDLANTLAAMMTVALSNVRLFHEREQYKQEAVLERSQQIVGTLTAGIAHDLNNALGAMLAGIQVISRLDDAERSELIEQLRGSIEHASQLTRSLLDVSRVSRNDRRDRVCELVSTARRAVEMVRAAAPPEIAIEIESTARAVWAAINPLACARILLNLLLNSVQAIGAASDGRIVIRIRTTGGHAVIEVDDNGSGIAPEHEARIFEPFLSFGKQGGSGVGLTAARGLAERAGGNLSLRHRPGPGALFEVRLEATPPREELDEPPPPSGVARRRKASGPAPRVLVAEDEPVQRRVFADTLRAAGFDVTEAATGNEASELVEAKSFDALVVDQRMPGVTGIDVVVRARELGVGTPVLMVSGLDADPQAVDALDGVTLVSKPIDGDDLVQRVIDLVAPRARERAAT